MSKATSWDPLEALLVPSSGTNPGDLRDDADRRLADVGMAAVLPLCRALRKTPGFRPTTGCASTGSSRPRACRAIAMLRSSPRSRS